MSVDQPRSGSAPRGLAVVASFLAVTAAFAGSPYAANHGHIDVSALAHAVQQEDDHVDAIELARWIKERRAGLRVIDVRTDQEFEAYHVPTAERIPLDSIPTTPFGANDTIVLYSEGGAHAAQAWVFLRALGYDHVYFLRGGLYEWLHQVMDPTFQAGATGTDSAANADAASISRYFGGTPHFGTPPPDDEALTLPLPRDRRDVAGGAPPTSGSASLVAKIRRRGC